jgi:hypothetical protein
LTVALWVGACLTKPNHVRFGGRRETARFGEELYL